MKKQVRNFLKASSLKAFDIPHRDTINFNIDKYNTAVKTGKEEFSDHELARDRASYIKEEAILNLDKYLSQFEKKFTSRGGKILWAEDSKEALEKIFDILKKKNTRSVVKSKTMTTEEIHLNENLEQENIEVVETDLGEYIVQLAGQKPYHIVTPAMHMSRKDISELFTEKLQVAPTDDATELTLTARRMLREKYTTAEVGITGGNFMVADAGGIAVTENEGNARLSTAFPKTHIAIIGIEKIIPRLRDLALMWPMLSTSGTGQQVTVYNSVFFGPKQSKEEDGPEEMYVILLDNGRTNLLADHEKRQALKCIRCGACLNACPVYKNIGGHSYDTTYSGPIGSVITPHYRGMSDFKHLSYASSLCGACTSVCPVKIDIHNLLLLNRKQSVEDGHYQKQERYAMRLYRKAMLNRKWINAAGSNIKNKVLGFLLKETWGQRRSIPKTAPRSFNQLWKDKYD